MEEEYATMKYEENLEELDCNYSKIILGFPSSDYQEIQREFITQLCLKFGEQDYAIIQIDASIDDFYWYKRLAVSDEIVYNNQFSNDPLREVYLKLGEVLSFKRGFLFVVTDLISNEKSLLDVFQSREMKVFFFKKEEKEKILENLKNKENSTIQMINGKKTYVDKEYDKKTLNLDVVDCLIEGAELFQFASNMTHEYGDVAIIFKKEQKQKVWECIENYYMPYREKIEAMLDEKEEDEKFGNEV